MVELLRAIAHGAGSDRRADAKPPAHERRPAPSSKASQGIARTLHRPAAASAGHNGSGGHLARPPDVIPFDEHELDEL